MRAKRAIRANRANRANRAIRAIGSVGLLLVGCQKQPTPARDSGTPPPSVRYDQHLFAGGKAPPGDTTTRNPFAKNPSSSKEREQLFASMNCDGCHGGGATGWV